MYVTFLAKQHLHEKVKAIIQLYTFDDIPSPSLSLKQIRKYKKSFYRLLAYK